MAYDAVFRALAVGDIDPTSRAWDDLVSNLGQPEARVEAGARLGALVALGASEPSFAAAIDEAIGAGVKTDDLVAALLALAPAVGSVRIVAVAPAMAAGLGIDLDTLLETDPGGEVTP